MAKESPEHVTEIGDIWEVRHNSLTQEMEIVLSIDDDGVYELVRTHLTEIDLRKMLAAVGA